MSRLDSKDVAAEVARIGDLSAAELRALWPRLFGRPVPSHLHRHLLVRAIAWQIQAEAFGGLSKAAARQLELIAAREFGETSTSSSPPRRLKSGTKLVREWHGTVYEVFVRDEGFDCGGTRYRSLSAIARAITGTNRSGQVFFGLKSAPAKAAAEAKVNAE